MRKFALNLILLSAIFYLLSVSSVFAQTPDTPFEYETACWRIEYNNCVGTEGDCNNAYTYRPPQINPPPFSSQTPRDDAHLDFSAAVRGAACGEVQSEPIKLKEVVGYDGPPWNACSVKAGWVGEITFNYGNSDNFWIPFAQELANDWAGTLDTEHLTVGQYDDLINRASNGDIVALEDKRQREGVLRKLLPMDYQDTLKCNFAQYAQKKVVQGKPTLYKGYKPDDQALLRQLAGACRNEVCPVGMTERGKCLSDYDSGRYIATDAKGNKFAPGPAWQKMGLIPNEKSRGDIKFFVCGDRQYDQITYYPEVFRMGLSANELFRIFTDKATQDKFYQGENEALKGNPLEWLIKNSVLGDSSTENVLASSNNKPDEISSDKKSLYSQPIEIRTKSTVPIQRESFVNKVIKLVKQFLPKVQKALAKTLDKYLPQKNTPVLLAQTGTTDSNNPSSGIFIGGKRCNPDNACCETFSSCTATCQTCNRTQFGPSESSIFSWEYPHGHILIGTGDWYLNTPEHVDHVVYSFKPNQSDCKFTPDRDEFGQFTSCSGGCGGGSSCGPGNVCGKWDCSKSHDRVVNVFNNVPFLGSVWKQVADAQFGFMNSIKPSGIVGNGSIPSDYVGCSKDQNMIFDKNGNYLAQHAASNMQWGFDLLKESYDKVILPPANSLEVTLDQDPSKKSKVLFYRLGGVCNANKWWTEKVLNPMLASGLTAGGLQQNLNIIQTCIQRNGSINPDHYYDISDNCKHYGLEPACCSKMGSGEYAKECDWSERRRCTLESCALIPEGQSKERCGQLIEVGRVKKGSEILKGK